MSMTSINVIGNSLVIQSGDTLIVALASRSTAANVAAVTEHFKSILPSTVQCTVLDGVAGLAVVKGVDNA